MAITVTSKGTDQEKALGSGTISVTGISAGDTLIVVSASDAGLSTVSWYYNGVNFQSLTRKAIATNAGNVVAEIWILENANVSSGGSNIYFGDAISNSAKSIAVYQVTGLASNSFDRSAAATGSSTSASSGATEALTQADELVIGAIGVEDAGDDISGSWTTGAGNVSGNEQVVGTTGSGDASNVTIYAAAEIVSAMTAQTAAVTGLDSIDWAACIATFKAAAAGVIGQIATVAWASVGQVAGVANASIAEIAGVKAN